MKKKEKTNRTKRVTLRFLPDEYIQVETKFKRTTCRKMSEYLRDILLNRKVTAFVRNQSMDEFMAEMILLRKELNAIGNNFNQVVHKLHMLDRIPQIETWALTNEVSKKMLFKKVEEIKEKINQFSDKWLQE